MEKKKSGGFLRWPWNVVVYILLIVVLRLFAIPVILILIGVHGRTTPTV